MHMKQRAHSLGRRAHARVGCAGAVEPLDVRVTECALGELQARLARRRDRTSSSSTAGASPRRSCRSSSTRPRGAATCGCSCIVEPEALRGAAPARARCRATSSCGARPPRSWRPACAALLWPGEEVSRAGARARRRPDAQPRDVPGVRSASEPIDFTYLEYALFAFLVTHPNRTYSRESAAAPRVGDRLLRRLAHGRRARAAHPGEDRPRAVAPSRDRAQRRLPLERLIRPL